MLPLFSCCQISTYALLNKLAFGATLPCFLPNFRLAYLFVNFEERFTFYFCISTPYLLRDHSVCYLTLFHLPATPRGYSCEGMRVWWFLLLICTALAKSVTLSFFILETAVMIMARYTGVSRHKYLKSIP